MHELTIFPPSRPASPIRLCISNCDKDGTIVSARIASSIGAIYSARPLRIQVDRYTDQTYFTDIGNTLAGYYRIADGNRLLSNKTVVLSSVHRAALYIAESLHAHILPLQLISFARNLLEAQLSPLLSIVGADDGVSLLWQWNKVSDVSHFPKGYVNLIKDADDLVIVRSTDTADDCPIEGRVGNVFVNRTLRRVDPRSWKNVCGELSDKGMAHHELRQWEWGLPDIAMHCSESLWRSLGKAAEHFHVIEGTTEDLFRAIPILWERYLQSNSIPVRGVTLNAYWKAHPYYERFAGLVPIHYYKFSMLKEVARAYIEKYAAIDAQTEQMCAFTNDVGSPSDSEDVRQLISTMGLQNVFWFSKGFDCPDAKCEDIYRQPIPRTYEKISEWITTAPYRSHEWMPMNDSGRL